MAERVGFIGVGKMGAPMVRRLLAAGHEVLLRDVDDAALLPFKSEPRARICGSPREVAGEAPVVLLSLPVPQALLDVLTAPDGVLSASTRPVVVDLSTSGVRASRAAAAALEARGFAFLDAPVSGGVPGAEKGTLAVMVAGARELHDRYAPLLSIIGKNVFYVGPEPGQGQAMKLVNNMLSSLALAATAEAMVVATKAGIDPDKALQILNVSSGQNTATRDKFPKDVVTGTFNYGFMLKLMLKDVKLFEELAEELSVPTIIAETNVNVWRIATTQGLATKDFTTITQMYERWAGVEVRSRAGGR